MINNLNDELSSFLSSTLRNEFEAFKKDIFSKSDVFKNNSINFLKITAHIKNNETTIRRAFELYPLVFQYFEYIRKNCSLSLQKDAITQSMILFGENYKPGSFEFYMNAIEKKIIANGKEYQYPKEDLDEIFKNYENTFILEKNENYIEKEIENDRLKIYTQSENDNHNENLEFHQQQKIIHVDKIIKKEVKEEKKMVSHQELASVS